jgi:hypothetical protein
LLAAGVLGGKHAESVTLTGDSTKDCAPGFTGSKAGDEREIGSVKLCWCPAGRFMMGSSPNEPERRPNSATVERRLDT